MRYHGEDREELRLDLQAAFKRAYDGGPYRRGAVDYAADPDPPLPEGLIEWADALLKESGLRVASAD